MTKIIDLTPYQLSQALNIEKKDNGFSNAIRFAALLKAAVALIQAQVDVSNIEATKQTNVGDISKQISQSIIKQANEVYKAYEAYKKEISQINKMNKVMMYVGIAGAIVSIGMMAFVGPGALIMAVIIVGMCTIPIKKTKDANGIDHYGTLLDLTTDKSANAVGAKSDTDKFFLKLGLLIGMSLVAGGAAGGIDGTLAARTTTEEVEEEMETEMEDMATKEGTQIAEKEAVANTSKDSLSETKQSLFKPAFLKSSLETGVFSASTLLGSLNPFENLFKAAGMGNDDAMYLSMALNFVLEIGMMAGIYKTASIESAAPAASMSSVSGRVVMRTLIAANVLLNLTTAGFQLAQSSAYNKLADTTDKQAQLQKIAVILKGAQSTVQSLEDNMSQAYQQLSAGAKSQTEGFSQWFGEDQAMANILGRFN